MGLYNEIVKQKTQYIHSQFWDDKAGHSFSDLSSIKEYSSNYLFIIQRSIIHYNLNQNQTFSNVNKFLRQINSYSQEDAEQYCFNNLVSAIADILNSPYKGSPREKNNIYGEKVKTLKLLLDKIKVDTPIPDAIRVGLEQEASLLEADFIKKYTQEKAMFFEKIARDIITNSNSGNTALSSGQIGNINHYRNPQLVTDIYAFCNNKLEKNVGSGKVYLYNTAESSDSKIKMAAADGLIINTNFSQLGNFINLLNQLGGSSSCNISIDDELEQTLNKISALRVQVKSGINQNLLNKNSRNAIALQEFDDYYLKLLSILYKIENKNDFPYLLKQQKSSNTLTSYANFLLSKNIMKTTLMTKNNLYFTEKGFETAYQWMSRKNYYLKFLSPITLNDKLLTRRRKYGLRSVNRN